MAEDAKPFLGSNFQATLRDLEAEMREAAGNLEFEDAARLRDEIKRLKMLDLEFAKDAMAGGEMESLTVRPDAPLPKPRESGGERRRRGR